MLLKLHQWPLVHTRLRRGRASAHDAPAAVPAEDPAGPSGPEKRPDVTVWQAAALCDLIADPKSGITRIHVVGARPALIDAVEEEASRRGLQPHTAHSAALGTARVVLERPNPGHDNDSGLPAGYVAEPRGDEGDGGREVPSPYRSTPPRHEAHTAPDGAKER